MPKSKALTMTDLEIREYLRRHNLRYHVRLNGSKLQQDRQRNAMARLVVHLHMTTGETWQREILETGATDVKSYEERQAAPRQGGLL